MILNSSLQASRGTVWLKLWHGDGLCDVFPTLGTEQHQRPRDPQLSAFGFEWLVYALPLGFVGFWEGTWWDLDGPYLDATGGWNGLKWDEHAFAFHSDVDEETSEILRFWFISTPILRCDVIEHGVFKGPVAFHCMLGLRFSSTSAYGLALNSFNIFRLAAHEKSSMHKPSSMNIGSIIHPQ